MVCVLFLLIQNSRWEMNCGHFKNVLINIFPSRSSFLFVACFVGRKFEFFMWWRCMQTAIDDERASIQKKFSSFFLLLFLSLYMAFLWIYDPMNETKKTKKYLIYEDLERQEKKLWMKFISWEIFHQIYNTYSCGARALEIKKISCRFGRFN